MCSSLSWVGSLVDFDCVFWLGLIEVGEEVKISLSNLFNYFSVSGGGGRHFVVGTTQTTTFSDVAPYASFFFFLLSGMSRKKLLLFSRSRSICSNLRVNISLFFIFKNFELIFLFYHAFYNWINLCILIQPNWWFIRLIEFSLKIIDPCTEINTL